MNFHKNQFQIFLLAFLTLALNCAEFRAINLLKQGTYTKSISNEAPGIPFRSIGNLIIVPISFEKDATQYLYILDTGAGSTVIGSGLCDSMKLLPQAEVMSGGTSGTAKKEKIVLMPLFNLGQYSMKDIAAVSINLSSVSSAAGIKISGIIGTNVLKHFKVFISYRNSVLKISDTTINMPNPNFTLPIQYSLSTSFLPLISGSISLKTGKLIKTDYETVKLVKFA